MEIPELFARILTANKKPESSRVSVWGLSPLTRWGGRTNSEHVGLSTEKQLVDCAKRSSFRDPSLTKEPPFSLTSHSLTEEQKCHKHKGSWLFGGPTEWWNNYVL